MAVSILSTRPASIGVHDLPPFSNCHVVRLHDRERRLVYRNETRTILRLFLDSVRPVIQDQALDDAATKVFVDSAEATANAALLNVAMLTWMPFVPVRQWPDKALASGKPPRPPRCVSRLSKVTV